MPSPAPTSEPRCAILGPLPERIGVGGQAGAVLLSRLAESPEVLDVLELTQHCRGLCGVDEEQPVVVRSEDRAEMATRAHEDAIAVELSRPQRVGREAELA